MNWHRFRTPLIVTALAAAAVLIGSGLRIGARPAEALAQDARPKEASKADARPAADEAAIRKAAEDYIAAMDKGDLDAVLACWAPDCEYIAEDGTETRGKDAVAELFRQALPELKDHKITARHHSIRTLRPDVAVEDGSIEFCGPDGCKEFNRYAVVWTRRRRTASG
jgi:uncharacterized protein (TIGR02246 family)